MAAGSEIEKTEQEILNLAGIFCSVSIFCLVPEIIRVFFVLFGGMECL